MKTMVPPWAGKHFRFTLLFKAFAIDVLQACRTVNAAAALLGLSWDSGPSGIFVGSSVGENAAFPWRQGACLTRNSISRFLA